MHSPWYGRRTLQPIQRHLLYRHTVDSILAFAGKQLPMSDSNWDLTKILRRVEKESIVTHCWHAKRHTALGISSRSPHPSTNPAQCCLTSVIRRELVHSAWYGRRTLQPIQRHLLYRHTVDSILAFAGKQLPMSDSNWDLTKILRRVEKESIVTHCWHAKRHTALGISSRSPHPSTNPAQSCLTSVIRREPVHSPWYGRRTLQPIQRHLLYRHTVDSILAFAGKQLPMSDSNWDLTNILRRVEKESIVTHCWHAKRHTALGISSRSPHPSTNPAQCCLTSVIRRELVHSAWYGRRTLQPIQRHLLYRHTVDSIGFRRKTATNVRQ